MSLNSRFVIIEGTVDECNTELCEYTNANVPIELIGVTSREKREWNQDLMEMKVEGIIVIVVKIGG